MKGVNFPKGSVSKIPIQLEFADLTRKMRFLTARRNPYQSLCIGTQRCLFSSGMDPNRIRQLRKSLLPVAGTMGRDRESRAFEKCISIHRMGSYEKESDEDHPMPTSSTAISPTHSGVDIFSMGANMRSASLIPGTVVVQFIPSPEYLRTEEGMAKYPAAVRQAIRSYGDCKLMGATVQNGTLAPSFDPLDTTVSRRRYFVGLTLVTENKPLEYGIMYCCQPLINSIEFRFEEAQVELMTAYRNMYVAVAETKGVNRLVLPPLCLHTAGLSHRYTIAKLNQIALIKASHRLQGPDREELLYNRGSENSPGLAVEVYVDDNHYSEFLSTFKENAWEPVRSLYIPERTDLYPGLAPPESMLDLEGWVGKRPELIEAVATKGKSLLEQQIALDGTSIVKCDGSTYMMERNASRDDRLAAERNTARALGYIPRPHRSLTTGLEGDDYQPVVNPIPEANVVQE